LIWATAMPAWADDPKRPSEKSIGAQQREAEQVAAALRESWPDHPEWVDMLTGILEEEPMGSELRLVPQGQDTDPVRLGIDSRAPGPKPRRPESLVGFRERVR
jgi:hypothetical protein